MSIEDIRDDLKSAQLQRDEVKVSTLRLLVSELVNAQIAKGSELAEQEVISVLQKEVKKRSEAAEGFRKGAREEEALKEEAEGQILKAYLPSPLSNEELTKIVEDSINEVGAKSLQDMGKVMGVVMGKVAHRADGGQVSALVKERLSS